jgi:hypothetical protein
MTTLKGPTIVDDFIVILDDYVENRFRPNRRDDA